jgi:HK97 family phage prohead protease
MAIPSSLERSMPFKLERADSASTGDGLTLDGYAAVFDTPTRIDSWEGCFDEQIQRGAFKKSIRENTPVLQFDHGRHPLIGSIPIGVITELAEDDAGLHVVGRMSDNWLIEPVRDAIANESVDGMSFRFEVVREEWRDNKGTVLKDPYEIMDLLWEPGERGPLLRILKEVRCAELGPVVFPAYKETSVGVRTKDEARSAQRETVRSLMLRSSDTAPPDSGHPVEERATPPDSGHLADTDAPPDAGHPSPTPDPAVERLRGYIREATGRMKDVLAPISKD